MQVEKPNEDEGYSLYYFSSNSRVRQILKKIVKMRYFDTTILILIILQSIFLALDNPLTDPQSPIIKFLFSADVFFTIIFSIEVIIKIIVYGFLINGKDSYMQNAWNIIDLIVVLLSIFSFGVSKKLKASKILRMLKVLRPLRVISRNKGLKIGIQALFMAVPNIINVIIVSLLFYVIFAILCVNYFKGTFFKC